MGLRSTGRGMARAGPASSPGAATVPIDRMYDTLQDADLVRDQPRSWTAPYPVQFGRRRRRGVHLWTTRLKVDTLTIKFIEQNGFMSERGTSGGRLAHSEGHDPEDRRRRRSGP